jgi:putative endonuclease
MNRNQQRGADAEQVALNFLLSFGMKHLASNWRSGRSEVDLVMLERDCLVFVEVKARNAETFDQPDDHISRSKIDALLRARDAWWDTVGEYPHFRIDLVVVLYGEESEILYLKGLDMN